MSRELIPYINQIPADQHRVFMRKIADQLAKDLYPLFEQEIPENPLPDWILHQLYRCIERVVIERNNSLGQLLYRIDLSEQKINALMAQTSADERVRVLAEEILEREAKKVWLRMHYSSQ